jgi:methylisocitrate lyase
MGTQADRVATFRDLHASGCFVIPNPWDVGSARTLARLGFKALATTSSGFAWTLGRPDNAVTLDEVLAHLRAIAESAEVPVNADFEGGFAVEPDAVAANVTRAVGTGIAGISIEDSTGDPSGPIYCKEHAVARVTAAVEAARSLSFPFTLTARAENFLHGRLVARAQPRGRCNLRCYARARRPVAYGGCDRGNYAAGGFAPRGVSGSAKSGVPVEIPARRALHRGVAYGAKDACGCGNRAVADYGGV